MSRMTKFLKQNATIQLMLRDSNGNPKLDDYGEPSYVNKVRKVKCRKEVSTKDVITSVGAAKKSATIYYFDETVSVTIGDKVDGKPILTVQEYINAQGLCEGYEVMV